MTFEFFRCGRTSKIFVSELEDLLPMHLFNNFLSQISIGGPKHFIIFAHYVQFFESSFNLMSIVEKMNEALNSQLLVYQFLGVQPNFEMSGWSLQNFII